MEFDFTTKTHAELNGTIFIKQVLSAAHCFFQKPTNNPNLVTVTVGSIDRNAGDIYNVQSIQIHPQYPQTVGYQFDAAVVQTSTYIVFNNYVRPIVLGVAGVSTGRECIVSGFGRTDVGYRVSNSMIQFRREL